MDHLKIDDDVIRLNQPCLSQNIRDEELTDSVYNIDENYELVRVTTPRACFRCQSGHVITTCAKSLSAFNLVECSQHPVKILSMIEMRDLLER